MAFKINSILFNDGREFITQPLILSKPTPENNLNYYTVVIGDNGIGKSRLLSNIIRLFNYIDKEVYPRNLPKFECGYTHSGSDFIIRRDVDNKPSRDFYKKLPRPTKIFAITNSLSDSFPNDNSMVPAFIRDNKDVDFQRQYYVYFGSRGRSNNASSYTLINKSFDVFFNAKKNKSHLLKACSLLGFMNYKPLIVVEYLIRASALNKAPGKHVKELISEVIENASPDPRLRNFLSDLSLTKLRRILSETSEEEFNDLNDFFQDGLLSSQRTLAVHFDLTESQRKFSHKQKQEKFLNYLSEAGVLSRRTFRFTKKDGEDFYFQKASSGEISLISMFFGLISVIKNDSLIIIDEPEVSLHPSWQFRYIELLKKMISDVSGCHVIIASHSHFILSDLPLEQSCVITLKDIGGGVIGSEEIKEETHGSSAEDILLNVFKLPTTRNYYLSVMVTNALEMISRGERSSSAFRDLIEKIKEIKINIKEEDPLSSIIEKIILLG